MDVGLHTAGQSAAEQKRILFADKVFDFMAVYFGCILLCQHIKYLHLIEIGRPLHLVPAFLIESKGDRSLDEIVDPQKAEAHNIDNNTGKQRANTYIRLLPLLPGERQLMLPGPADCNQGTDDVENHRKKGHDDKE